MGDTRYVVEPNIKEGKGDSEIFKHCIGLLNFYGVSNVAGWCRCRLPRIRPFHQAVSWTCAATSVIWRGGLRNGSRTGVQTISERMTYAEREGISGVERFMKHYFLIAKDVGDLTRVLCAVLEDQQKTLLFRLRACTIMKRFQVDQTDHGGRRRRLSTEPLKILHFCRSART